MNLDIEKLIKDVSSNLDLSKFQGDVVMYKHVDNQFGNVETGAIAVQNVYYSSPGVLPKKEEKEAGKTTSSRYCKYIDAARFTEAYKGQSYTIEDYENTLHEASKGTAKSFANVLTNGVKAGFLNFYGDDKKTILTYFQQHFPDMNRYSYQNFSDALTLPS